MPTSKDILKDSEKHLKANAIVKMALQDSIKTGQQDTGEFAKAQKVLIVSVRSMTESVKQTDKKLKSLNKLLSELKKAAPVMKAPADKKVYDKLMTACTDNIKMGMTLQKDLEATLKKAQQFLSGK